MLKLSNVLCLNVSTLIIHILIHALPICVHFLMYHSEHEILFFFHYNYIIGSFVNNGL